MTPEQIDRIEAEISTTFFSATELSANSLLELCALARRGLVAEGLIYATMAYRKIVQSLFDLRNDGPPLHARDVAKDTAALLAFSNLNDATKLVDATLGDLHAAPPNSAGEALLTNPHTGEPRDYRDVESDPASVLITAPGEPLRAAGEAEQQAAAPSPPKPARETKCDYCDGSGFLNVLDEDGEMVIDLCDAPAHDHEDDAPSTPQETQASGVTGAVMCLLPDIVGILPLLKAIALFGEVPGTYDGRPVGEAIASAIGTLTELETAALEAVERVRVRATR